MALLAACGTPSRGPDPNGAIGIYYRSDPPEHSFELELLPGGAFVACDRCAGHALPESRSEGAWTIEGDVVSMSALSTGATRLLLRRWNGYAYLVPPDLIEFFDSRGPIYDLCYAKQGAPISMFVVGQRN